MRLRRPLPKSLVTAGSHGRGLDRSHAEGARVCRLAPLHSERSLARALAQHLAEELPEVEFTLEDRADVDVLWICGYERGNADLIRRLRQRHPDAELLVTAKAPQELWSAEALAAGADDVLSWPADLASLARALRRRPLQRRA